MADRNTVILGNQIKDATVTEDELNTSIAGDGVTGGAGSPLAVNVDDSSLEIDTDVVQVKALGITNAMLAGSIADTKLVEDYIKTSEVDDSSIEFGASLNVKALGITNAMLAGSITDAKLDSDYIQTSEVDDSSIEFGASLNVKALGITNTMLADDSILEAKLDATNVPTDNYLLSYDQGTGGFTWVESPAVSGIQEADLAKDDFSATLNSALTDFDLTDVPVIASLQVYINGMLAQEGSGKDYELNPDSGQTKTIRVAGDVLAAGEKLIAHYIKDN